MYVRIIPVINPEFNPRLADVILLSTPEYKKVLIASKTKCFMHDFTPRIKYSEFSKYYVAK